MQQVMRIVLCVSATLALLLWAGDRGLATGDKERASGPKFGHVVAESCGAGKDLVVQALERMRADSAHPQLSDANELLKRAADLCSESGEAWYYRALVEAKLGHAPVAEYAMRRAKMFPSDALANHLNPFQLATPNPGGAEPLGAVHERWALVIGIGSFTDPSIKPLAYSAGDAQFFRNVLTEPKHGGFKAENVRLLTDGAATLRSIKEGLNWLARNAKPDDLAVVYIASHGSSRDLDTAGANYIVTHDTEVGEKVDPDALYATALPMVELSNAVATRLQARRTAIFIDTCYSGGATTAVSGRLIAPGIATAGVSAGTLEHMGQGSGRMIFAASRTDQESLESDDLKHGYFTYFVVQALQQHPELPLTQVFTYVQQHVSVQVAKDYKLYNLQQTPVMSRSADDVDFSLGTPATVATASVRAR